MAMKIGCVWTEIPVHVRQLERRNQQFRFRSCVAAIPSENRMCILGMGYVGQFCAKRLINEGWTVTGTCTSLSKKTKLQHQGFDICILDANEPQLDDNVVNLLKCHTHLLVAIPPFPGIGDLLLQHNVELLRRALMGGDLRWLCYLSSTGVYGHSGGAWVDEDYPTNSFSEVVKSRLAAEDSWLSLGHDLGVSTQVFRCGGIYGPGRSAIDTIIKQLPLSESQKMRSSRQFTARIHVEDIYQALKACICTPVSRRIYNMVDDDPASREEVFMYAKNLIEMKWPGKIQQSTSLEGVVSSSKVFNPRGEKRVSNARMKRELRVRLLYPSYRDGLRSIIDQMEDPFRRCSSNTVK